MTDDLHASLKQRLDRERLPRAVEGDFTQDRLYRSGLGAAGAHRDGGVIREVRGKADLILGETDLVLIEACDGGACAKW